MRLPLSFDPVSNGEYLPPEKTVGEGEMERRARESIDRAIRRTGIDRRLFLQSSAGMAACLAAINTVSGGTGGSYLLPPGALQDSDAAGSVLGGDEFIFDIQTHHVMPGARWEKSNPAMKMFLKFLPGKSDFSRHAFVKEIFLDSDTTCAVLSAVPAGPKGQPLPQDDAETTRDIVNQLGTSPRLWTHALVTPNWGELKPHLEGMEAVSKKYQISAWKVYTLFGPGGMGYWLDDEKVGIPMIEQARSLGIKTICSHKGFPLFGSKGDFDRPRDIGVVAKKYPDVKFIVYHSGYDPKVPEGAYDPKKADRGINALLQSLQDNGIKPGGNVYAEIGSTWWSVMKKPTQAAHVLGKLLKYVGPKNVLWGTDCIWYGSPQPQIAAFRSFQISEELCEKHGYPELTKPVKADVFGLNAAKVYGVDPKKDRPKIEKDAVEKLKQSYLPNRNPSHRLYGPRTRREFFALLKRRGGMPA